MSRRKPPLESPHWWPIEQALEQRSQQIGSDKLASQDFNQVLKASRLRAMVRRADGSRELLGPSAWDDFYCSVLIRLRPALQSGGMAVFSRKLGKRPPMQWFFVWKPDYKKIFGDETETTKPPAQVQEVPIKRGKKPVHDRANLQAVALVLAVRKKHGAPEKTPKDVVDELREWCDRNERKVPADSTLYEIVAAAFRLKPTLPR
jgi:hypothetical protein